MFQSFTDGDTTLNVTAPGEGGEIEVVVRNSRVVVGNIRHISDGYSFMTDLLLNGKAETTVARGNVDGTTTTIKLTIREQTLEEAIAEAEAPENQ